MHMCVLGTALLHRLCSACTEGEDLCSLTWKQREDIYNEATTGMPRQVHLLFLQILWHPRGRKVFCSRGLASFPLRSSASYLQADPILHWLLPGSAHKPLRWVWIGKPGLSQLWQPKAGLSPAIQLFLLSRVEHAPTLLP